MFDATKVEITEDKFRAYVKVQESGVTNMFDVKMVTLLSRLTREECFDIMEHYGEYREKFMGAEA